MAKVTRKSNFSAAKLENHIKRGLLLGGQLVAQRAQERVHVITGRLKRSIAASQPQQIGAHAWRVTVGSNVEYATEEEFRPGEKHGTPHAYLRPALGESIEEIKQIVGVNVVAGLKR